MEVGSRGGSSCALVAVTFKLVLGRNESFILFFLSISLHVIFLLHSTKHTHITPMNVHTQTLPLWTSSKTKSINPQSPYASRCGRKYHLPLKAKHSPTRSRTQDVHRKCNTILQQNQTPLNTHSSPVREKKPVPNYDYELVWYVVQIHMYRGTNLQDEQRLAFRCVIYTDMGRTIHIPSRRGT